MSSITVNPDEFLDVICMMMLDAILNKESIVSTNPKFQKLMKAMNQRGIQPLLLQYFLTAKGSSKQKYAMLRSGFENSETASIFVKNNHKTNTRTMDESVLAEIVKRVVQEVVQKNNPNEKKLKQLTEQLEREFLGGSDE